jgi:hypothetical protein
VKKMLLLVGLSLGAWAGPAGAQGIYPGGALNPANRPAYSPYLNLLRRDARLDQNYFGLVRPEINFRNSLQQLQQQQSLTSTQQTTLENALALPPTGHASQFMSHSKYFLNKGGGAPAGRFSVTPGAATPAAAKGARR